MALSSEIKERVVYTNLEYIRVTPWESESTGPNLDTYDLTEVVADTTSVEQAENDSNVLEHEFSSSPLYENIQLGDKTFTCESIDLQNGVLKGLFGWYAPDNDDNVYAPIAYKHLYATIEMGFHGNGNVIVLPKVLLNSRAVIASMKTDASRANITGTCYPAFVNSVETDMAIIKDGKNTGDDGASIIAMVKAEKKATGA
jgi:hypothetical protein